MYFIPYVIKSAVVIRGAFLHHLTVGDVYNPARALFRFDPVSDLDHAELKQP